MDDAICDALIGVQEYKDQGRFAGLEPGMIDDLELHLALLRKLVDGSLTGLLEQDKELLDVIRKVVKIDRAAAGDYDLEAVLRRPKDLSGQYKRGKVH